MKKRILALIMALVLAPPALGASPELSVTGTPTYGTWLFDGTDPTPVTLRYEAGDPLGIGFSWSADASAYGGTIAGYRMGWDIIDPNDPLDPGWLVPDFGPFEFTAQKVFPNVSVHSFIVDAKDDQGNVTRATFWIEVLDEVPIEGVPLSGMKALYR